MKLSLGTKQKGVKMCLNPPKINKQKTPLIRAVQMWKLSFSCPGQAFLSCVVGNAINTLCITPGLFQYEISSPLQIKTTNSSGLAFLDRLREDLCKKKALKGQMINLWGICEQVNVAASTNF